MHFTHRLLSPFVLIANLLLFVLLTAAAYGGRISPTQYTFPSIVAMTFPAWLILTVICLVVNFFFFRKIAIINIVSLLCCWGPIMEYSPINFPVSQPKGAKSGQEFTLMNYNVLNLTDFRYAEDEDPKAKYTSATIDFIMETNPDIVALQECSKSELNRWGKLFPQALDSLEQLYPFRSLGGKDGQSLLSKYPFERVEIPDLPEMPTFLAVCYKLDVEGHPLYLINVHLQSIGLNPKDKALYMELTEGEARSKKMLKEVKRDLLSKLSGAFRNRAVQARALRDFINTLPQNVILCGDFNDIPDSYSIRTIMGADMHSAYSTRGLGPGISYHADRFYFRIDHCLYRGDMEPLSCKVIRNPSSDHYPLLTKFYWK